MCKNVSVENVFIRNTFVSNFLGFLVGQRIACSFEYIISASDIFLESFFPRRFICAFFSLCQSFASTLGKVFPYTYDHCLDFVVKICFWHVVSVVSCVLQVMAFVYVCTSIRTGRKISSKVFNLSNDFDELHH